MICEAHCGKECTARHRGSLYKIHSDVNFVCLCYFVIFRNPPTENTFRNPPTESIAYDKLVFINNGSL